MRIRSGYISNSSSSSFIIIGWKITPNAKLIRSIADLELVDLDMFSMSSANRIDDEDIESRVVEILEEIGWFTTSDIVGICLVEYLTYEPIEECSLEDIALKIGKAKEYAELLNLPKPKVYYGTRYR